MDSENGGVIPPGSDASTGTSSSGATSSSDANKPAPGSVDELPANRTEDFKSGVPKPEPGEHADDTPAARQAHREQVHETAETQRAQGTGSEAPRFNPGATE